jgi:hypothetical protein
MNRDAPKINVYHHNAQPQIQPNYNTEGGFNFPTINRQFNPSFNDLNQFANFSQTFPNSSLDPFLNSQNEQIGRKSSNGIFKNFFRKNKNCPQVQNTVQPNFLNNAQSTVQPNFLFNAQSPYSFCGPQLNSFGQMTYPENMFYNISQPFLNNSGTFSPLQNNSVAPIYSSENLNNIQNQAIPNAIASDGVFSTPLEFSKQKFSNSTYPNLEAVPEVHSEQVPLESEVIHRSNADDRMNEEPQVNANTDDYNESEKRSKVYNNGPLFNTINYLNQRVKTTTLDRALKLDNKMNDKKYNRFASLHNGPKVTNKKALTIWEIDQLINENYNNRFWKDDLDELVYEKFKFVEA